MTVQVPAQIMCNGGKDCGGRLEFLVEHGRVLALRTHDRARPIRSRATRSAMDERRPQPGTSHEYPDEEAAGAALEVAAAAKRRKGYEDV